MSLPIEIINKVFLYSSSPTASLIKNFVTEVERVWDEETGLEYYVRDRDFRFAVWANGESVMLRRFAIEELGIEREGITYDEGGW